MKISRRQNDRSSASSLFFRYMTATAVMSSLALLILTDKKIIVPTSVLEAAITNFSIRTPVNGTYTSQNNINQDFSSSQQSVSPPALPTNLELYWNLSCPLERTVYSQIYMSYFDHPNATAEEELMYGRERAQIARQYALDSRGLEKVYHALTSGLLKGRAVVFDGDSLTRQQFISLACLAHSSGYLVNHTTEWRDYEEEEAEKFRQHHAGFIGRGQYSLILRSVVELKDGGSLFFTDRYRGIAGQHMYQGNKPIRKLVEWVEACESNGTMYQEGRSLTPNDFVVINAGLHPDRNKQVEVIRKLISCVTKNHTETTQTTAGTRRWPHFIYKLTTLQHFWTAKGTFDARFRKEGQSCNPKVNDYQRQYGDRQWFENVVPLLGTSIDQLDLGHLKVWRGDCTHWILPGFPDAVSGELVELMQEIVKNETSSNVQQ